MQIAVKSLVFSSAVFCAAAAFAANQARVEVPFSFTAQGQSYPAGSYEVSLDANHNFVTMASKLDAAKHITWSVGPAEAAKTPAVVRFDATSGSYSLKTIQVGVSVTPVLDKDVKAPVSATTSIGGQ